MADVIEDINARIDARYRGASVVCIGSVAAAWQTAIDDLRRRGAREFLVIHSGLGTGAIPTGPDVELVPLGIDIPRGDIIEDFRVWTRAADDVPDHVVEAIDRFDPDHLAVLLCNLPTPIARFGGRQIHGGRRREWVALEDKTTVDELLDRAGVAHTRSEVIAVHRAPEAASRVDAGGGTVWSGDARDGFNGGATRVRWITCDLQTEAALEFFSAHHGRVRVAPFVEGVPCSIHGMVGASGVAVFRPCELLIFRSTAHRFVYCGVATSWDPDPADRETMVAAARRVGRTLHDDVDFRGTFTLDGIMSADGFVATEVNPRFGGGMSRIAAGVDDLPLAELHRELIAEPAWEPDSQALESVILAAADERRSVTAWTFLDTVVDDTMTLRFVLGDGGAVPVAPGEAAIEATFGPAVTGSMLRVDFAEVAPDPGPMFGPLAADALTAAADLAGLDFPKVSAARRVR